MKVTAEHPVPVPITWTLTLDDDEMAALIVAVVDTPNTKLNTLTYAKVFGAVKDPSWTRLLKRGRDLEVIAQEGKG